MIDGRIEILHHIQEKTPIVKYDRTAEGIKQSVSYQRVMWENSPIEEVGRHESANTLMHGQQPSLNGQRDTLIHRTARWKLKSRPRSIQHEHGVRSREKPHHKPIV
jgi:hypothetical protein